MRSSLVLVLMLLSGLAGAYLGWEAGRSACPSGGPGPGVAPRSSGDAARWSLRGPKEPAAVRETVLEEVAGTEVALAEGEAPPDEVARESALEAWRARQAADRDRRLEERERVAREWTLQRSIRFADELHLAPGSELRIAEILLETEERIARVRQDALTLGSNPDGRDRLREGALEVRAWRDARFEESFGPELARRILAFEDGETTLGMSPEGPEGTQKED